MRLVIEEVADGHRRRLHAISAPVVGVRERPPKKASVQAPEEGFDASVLLHSGRPQSIEVIEQDGVQSRRSASISLKPCHPYLIAEQDVIQQTVDTAERALSLFPILGIVQLCTLLKKPLVCDPVVASKHLKMAQ